MPKSFPSNALNTKNTNSITKNISNNKNTPSPLHRHQSDNMIVPNNNQVIPIQKIRRKSCEDEFPNMCCECLMKGDYFGGTSILRNNSISLYKYEAKGDVICMCLDSEKFKKHILENVFYIFYIVVNKKIY